MDDYIEETEIDPDELIIIRDKENWRPKREYILAYALKLGFDISNDPPELLNIAEKYLTVELPDEYVRAFTKDGLNLLYINTITNEIEPSSEIEKEAQREYLMMKEKLKNEENKVKVIPRKKIAPIGSKKASLESNSEKEKDFLKRSGGFNENKKEKKGVTDKLFKREIEKNKNRINDEIKKSDKKIYYDNEEEEDDENNLSEKKYEINSKQIINKKDSQKNENNLRGSSNIIKNFDNPSSSDEDNNLIKPISSKKNMIKKEKSFENLKVSKEIENESPDKIEGKKFNSINSKFQRSNKKRQNLRYDRKSLDKMNEEINIIRKNEENYHEISSDENNANNKNKIMSLSISKNSQDSNDLEELKNNYIKKVKKDLQRFKENKKENYIKDKKNFIDNKINDLNYGNKNKIKQLKKDNSESLLLYETELKNKMNLELEKFKQNLINEFIQDSNDIEEENEDGSNNKKKLEIKINKIKSEIAIQKEKNKMKKEIFEQKKINQKNEKLEILNNKHKKEMTNLERQSKIKIDNLINQFQKQLNLYKNEFEIKNKNLKINIIPKENDYIFDEELVKYKNDLKEQLDENINKLKNEYDIKLNKDIEIFKEELNQQNSEDRINKENKDIEKEYFDELTEIKNDNKLKIKKTEETIKNLFEKISNSFDEINNKSKNNINKLISDIIGKITELIYDENNENKKESLINDFLSELISKKLLILNKYSSYVDIAEEEYKQNTMLIEYFIDIIRMINEIIIENNKKENDLNIGIENKNELFIKEILQRINDLMEDYKYKYEEEQSNKLYPLLYDTLQKLMNLKFDNENNYTNLAFNSSRRNPLINSNPNVTNINYLNNINNSVINESNLINNSINNNNNFFSIRTNNNFNQKIFSSENNNIQINSSRQTQLNNSSLYLNPLTQRNNYNSKQNLSLNYNNIFPIKEDSEYNLVSTNFGDINIPQIPNEILNNFNAENIRNYKLIINFLVNEYQQILQEHKIYYNRSNANQKLDNLKESGEYSKYNYIFEQISKQENDKNRQYLKDIESKKKVLELIRSNCEESFNFIFKYCNKDNIINNKLRVLITHIEDYNGHFNSKKFHSKNNNIINDNLQNLLNNTFQIERNNFNQQNILNETFSSNYKQNRSNFYNTYNSFRNYY